MAMIIFSIALIIFLIIFAIIIASYSIKKHEIELPDHPSITPYHNYIWQTSVSMFVIINGKTYVIPEGFTTDLASIPRIFWSITSPFYSKFVSPAIIHDYLYRSGTCISRKFADEILYNALIKSGVNHLTAFKFYACVRLFGKIFFRK
jgi:hypothetical protein